MSKIIIKSSGKHLLCTFDTYGNIYFAPTSEPDNLYDLVITNTNTITCEKCVNMNTNNIDNDNDYDIIIGELESFKNKNTLRGKIISEMKEDDDDDNNGYNSDHELTEDVQKTYFSENLEFNEYIDIDGKKKHKNKNKNKNAPFSFSFVKGLGLKDIVFYRDDICALYDTLIYDGSCEESNLLMKTTHVSEVPLYRLCIYTSGDVKFRAIGAKEIIYKLHYDPKYGVMLMH